MASPKPDCKQLGLKPAELGPLHGFSRRVVPALAHLREAWACADEANAQAVEKAIRALLWSHSFQNATHTEIAERVLLHGLDESLGIRLLTAVGLLPVRSNLSADGCEDCPHG
jgi:hypothetical protein